MKKDSIVKMESQRKSDCYPGPFSNRHKYKYRKMLVTFCHENKKNTINAALDLLYLAGIKADPGEITKIYENRYFYEDYYILPFFMDKYSVKSNLESLLFTDEVLLFENERNVLNQNFIDACFLFEIPIRFIDKDPICNAYRILPNDKFYLTPDILWINELRQTLAESDYGRYPSIELYVDYGSTAFWKNGANISKNVLYSSIPQLLYRRIYEWADAYWCFIEEKIDDAFIDNYDKEASWIFNELKSRIGEYVKITLSADF